MRRFQAELVLGFVTSIGWLDTDYGFKLQEFFLRNFRIVAVIESQVEKWFEDARVTTAVTILQRELDEDERSNNLVRFIQLRKPLAEVLSQVLDLPPSEEGDDTLQNDMDAIRDIIEELDAPTTTDYWRVRIRTQRELWEEGLTLPIGEEEEKEVGAARYTGGKWGQYVRGPESWFKLTEQAGDRMVPLRNLANITRGFTSGADRFYCVRDVTQLHLDRTTDPQEFRENWGISREQTRRIRIVQDGESALPVDQGGADGDAAFCCSRAGFAQCRLHELVHPVILLSRRRVTVACGRVPVPCAIWLKSQQVCGYQPSC